MDFAGVVLAAKLAFGDLSSMPERGRGEGATSAVKKKRVTLADVARLAGLSSAAASMILTGRPVGADEALAMGLANRVVAPGGALDAAIELASSIAAFPPNL